MKTRPHYILAVAALMALLVFANPGEAHSEDCCPEQMDILSRGEKMLLDALLLRPLGLVATVAGTAVYGVSLPFSLMGGNEAEVRQHLLNEPAKYTFKRPLGEFNH